MKKIRLLCLILCFIIVIAFGVQPVCAAENNTDQSVICGPSTLDGKRPVLGSEQLIENAEAVILYEVRTGTLMHAWNHDVQMYPASLVKIMTALLVLEEADLSDVTTVTQNALDSLSKNAAAVGLKTDEVMSIKDLLLCMLVGSANDAAAVLAEHICGSQESFVKRMNDRAQELGCTGTLFTDATGIDGNQYSTARDLALILIEAMQYPEFMEIFGTVYYYVPATNKSDTRLIETNNSLISTEDMQIYYDPRVIGGRTGQADNGDRFIAATAQSNGMELVSIILGSKSVYADDGITVKIFGGFNETSDLLTLGFEGYHPVQVLFKNQALTQEPVVNGDSDVIIGPQVSISTILPADVTENNLIYRFSNEGNGYHSPIKAGDVLTDLEIWYQDICVGQAELYAMNKVNTEQAQDVSDSNTTSLNSTLKTIILYIGIGVGGCLMLLLALRITWRIRLAAAKKRSRNYRKNRRRSR